MDCCKPQGHEENRAEKKDHALHSGHAMHSSSGESHQDHSGGSLRVNKHYLFIGLVGLLLVFSLVQAVQLSSVRVDVALSQVGGVGGGQAASLSASQSAQRASAPSPTMVGGC